MKYKLMLALVISMLTIGALSSCGSDEKTSLANTISFNADEVNYIEVDYDEDDINIIESEEEEIIIKEYMSENKKVYYGKDSIKNYRLLITEGERPRRSSFHAYIEVYIPKDYSDAISVHTTKGYIYSQAKLSTVEEYKLNTTKGKIDVENVNAKKLNISSTDGDLKLRKIKVKEIEITSTNGDTVIKKSEGRINYEAKGGQLNASEISGEGEFNVSGDGTIDINFEEIKGDIFAYAKNGNITVKMPEEASFEFLGKSKEGKIETSFDTKIKIKDNTAMGNVGKFPKFNLSLETRNGDIHVE